MFVACWRWVDDAWETTDRSVNLDLVISLDLLAGGDTLDGNGPKRWTARVAMVNGDRIDLLAGAPSRADVLALVGIMLDQTGIGRWPGPQTVGGATAHLAEPPRSN